MPATNSAVVSAGPMVPESTYAATSSGAPTMKACTTTEPIEWPKRTTGASPTSARARRTSASTSASTPAMPREPIRPRPVDSAVSPCPRRSSAYTAHPSPCSTSATRAYRPECSAAPCTITTVARGFAEGSHRRQKTSTSSAPASVNSSIVCSPPLLEVLGDVDRFGVGDDILAVEVRDVHEVVGHRAEEAEPRCRRRPRRREALEIDVLRGCERFDNRVLGDAVDVGDDVHERERGHPGIERRRLQLLGVEDRLARRLHVGEELLETREVLHV